MSNKIIKLNESMNEFYWNINYVKYNLETINNIYV